MDTNPAAAKIPVTIVVPIKNEVLNLERCIKALSRFHTVIVVDSGSTDGSQALAESLGARVVQFQWDGKFPKKRNWTLRNEKFDTEWVLFLDADEVVTPQFVEEVAQRIQDTSKNGYWIQYTNYFMGRPMKHGDPFRKLAMLRLGHGEYERIDEAAWSNLDMEVHEHLVVKGGVGVIAEPVEHNDFKGLDAYYRRHNDYSSWEASRYLGLSQANRQNFTSRQKLKYALLASPLFPPLYFLGAYFLKRGFLDGAAGFRFAVGKMFYFYQIGFKIAEIRERESRGSQVPGKLSKP